MTSLLRDALGSNAAADTRAQWPAARPSAGTAQAVGPSSYGRKRPTTSTAPTPGRSFSRNRPSPSAFGRSNRTATGGWAGDPATCSRCWTCKPNYGWGSSYREQARTIALVNRLGEPGRQALREATGNDKAYLDRATTGRDRDAARLLHLLRRRHRGIPGRLHQADPAVFFGRRNEPDKAEQVLRDGYRRRRSRCPYTWRCF